jgi:L-lactate dehydrogenase
MPTQIETTRVVIVGTGFVGSSIAYATMIQGLCSEIVLIDVNQEKARGEALDLAHGLPLLAAPVKVWAGTYDDCATADIIVITAGLAQKPGQTRLDLAAANVKIVGGIVDEVVKRTKTAVILLVTNPVDVLTLAAIKRAGLPEGQIFGSGTVLDSARFRFFLSEFLEVNPHSVHAYVIGEHGDSEVAYLSHSNVSGEAISSLPNYDAPKAQAAFERTRKSAAEIIQKKGATYYGIGIVGAEIIRAVLTDSDQVMPVSALMTGRYGLPEVCLSFPSVIGRKGIKRVLDLSLDENETKQLRASAASLRGVLDGLDF